MDAAADRNAPRVRAVALAGFVCAAFAAAGAAVLLAYRLRGPLPGVGVEAGALALRAGLFGIAAGAAAAVLWRAPAAARGRLRAALPARRWLPALGAACVPALLLMLPNLGAYPWAAPDEVHHLAVAKNLALHGRYASGSPEAGFRDFDPFDSVGPPVIVPVAAVFRVFGFSVAAARGVMEGYFLGLCTAVFFFLHGRRNPWGAACGAVLVTLAFSSVYLGRTLYGEVPALAWLVASMAAWRKALDGARPLRWGLACGALLALAAMCKTIILFAVFPLAAVWLIDRAGPRRIRLVHIAPPAAACLALLALWAAAPRALAPGAPPAGGSVMALYAPYLLFGIEPLPGNLAYFAGYPWAHLVIAFWLCTAARHAADPHGDPPRAALNLLAILFVFWWSFFTPGQLPRYLWPAYAIAAMRAGEGVWQWLRAAASPARPPRTRAACLAAAALVLGPTAAWVAQQSREVYFNREMHDDEAVAAYVRALPPQARIAAAFDPMRGTLRLLSDREAAPWRADAAPAPDAVVALGAALPEGLEARYTMRRAFGRYAVFERAQGAVP